MPKFLDVRNTLTAIVCSPNEVDTIKHKLSQLDIYLKNVDSLDNGILAD